MANRDQDDESFFKNYSACGNVINSAEASVAEKAAAWRYQSLLLQHLTRNSSATMRFDILGEHFAKPAAQEENLQECLAGVEKLLDGFTPEVRCTDLEFPDLSDLQFEPACRGQYESCRKQEFNAEKVNAQDMNVGVNVRAAAVVPKERNASNTIANFLRKSNSQQQPAKLNNATALTGTNVNARKRNFCETENLPSTSAACSFRTAREELMLQNKKKYGATSPGYTYKNNSHNTPVSPSSRTTAGTPYFNYANSNAKRTLGSRRTVRSNFVPPVRVSDDLMQRDAMSTVSPSNTPPDAIDGEPLDERLCNIDRKMIEMIRNEIMHKCENVDWSDIAGLKYAKSIIQETIVLPIRRPDIFNNLRRPPRGILLFGPPGTGKTLIGKCIASQVRATFFSISASSLTSKWMGDSEKMVRALFAVAAVEQPSVVFIDEIDSLLSKRSETEHEASRRLKTEFLARIEGAATNESDNIIIVGATNRPQELDDAARRRLVRRLYIPLPDLDARVEILNNLLRGNAHTLSSENVAEVARLANGYSGADMKSLCQEASLAPIRDIPLQELDSIEVKNVRAINLFDFQRALQNVSPSVSPDDINQYIEWNRIYGAGVKS